MVRIFNLDQIKSVLEKIDVLSIIEQGFVAYSQGKVVVPPVAELLFDDPPGDVHIKYGYIRDDDYYVIKIASGFYNNIELNLPTGSGLMLLFRQRTGELASILLDECYLTDVRTAAAGAIAARYLAPAPAQINRIGIFGAGVQGKMQLQFLSNVCHCKDVIVWGINDEELRAYKDEMSLLGYNVETTQNAEQVASSCNLIVMATPSQEPLLMAGQIRRGTHITAMGSDTTEKQELDPEILSIADLVVADSIEQCKTRGEIFKALSAGKISGEEVIELGNVIASGETLRKSDDQITIADLTGVAVQDIQIAKAVYQALSVLNLSKAQE